MSMTLEDVSDESEYQIDDRKYYSQTYKIKVRGYIIRKEDYQVERIPSRLVMTSHDSDASGIINRKGKNRREDERVVFLEGFKDSNQYEELKVETIKNDYHCESIGIDEKDRPKEVYEENNDASDCCPQEPNKYYNKIMKIIMNFDECTLELSFEIDKEMVLESVETENVYDFKLLVNEEVMNLDNEIRFLNGDKITVRISRDDLHKNSKLTLIGYDPNVAFDKTNISETVLDEPIDEEDIMINFNEEEEI
jgi:hypothetical protein